MELNNYLPLFPVSIESNNISPEYINEILLHIILNGWANKSHLQVRDFRGKTYKDTCDIFDLMEIANQVYKILTPSKNTTTADADRASHGIKLKGG